MSVCCFRGRLALPDNVGGIATLFILFDSNGVLPGDSGVFLPQATDLDHDLVIFLEAPLFRESILQLLQLCLKSIDKTVTNGLVFLFTHGGMVSVITINDGIKL